MANFIFPKPDIPSPKYSSRDLSLTKKTTFAPGVLIPILMKDILPGDKITINLDSLIESLPMIAPCLDGWKANFDFYFEPWSNLYGFMDNNRRESTEDLILKNRHTFTFGYDRDDGSSIDVDDLVTHSVKPSSFHDYYGLPCGYFGDGCYLNDDADYPSVRRESFPAEKWLAYWDIVRTYYVNNQEGQFPVLLEPGGRWDGDLTGVAYLDLSVLDNLMMIVRSKRDGIDLTSDFEWQDPNYDVDELGSVSGFVSESLAACRGAFHGLALRTYRMDLNRGIMNQDVGQYKSRVNVTDGQFSIDTLRFANKLQKLIDRYDVSGGRFSDWMRTQWQVKARGRLDVPDYLGTVSEFFGNTDIIATANGANGSTDTANPTSTLGQQAGFAVGRVKRDNKPISFKSDQYGTLVCIFSLVPLVDYSQGIERENLKTTFASIYSPAMAQLGYQDVDRRELSALPTLIPDQAGDHVHLDDPTAFIPAVGKRVAWSEYMASLGRNHGYFAYGENFDYWANQRLYTTEYPELNPDANHYEWLRRFGFFNSTTYVLPAHWNYLFAQTDRHAQNFRLRVRFDIDAKRPIGSRLMPHL